MFKRMISLVAIVGLVLALAPAAPAGTIDLDDPLVPTGLVEGNTFHLAFVTSTKTDAVSADIGYYNTFVNTAANHEGSAVAGHDWTWYAIVSTVAWTDAEEIYHPAVDAIDNTHTTYTEESPGFPIYRVFASSIADGYDDLWDARIAHPLYRSEYAVYTPAWVWTGTNTEGTHSDYPVGADTIVQYAENCFCDHTWIASGTYDRTLELSIYAISEPLHVTETLLRLWWDTDSGTADAQDGNGTWSHGGGDNWWDGSANVEWDNEAAAVAIFGAGNATTDPTVTVDAVTGVTASGIVFDAAAGHNYTLTGGTITLEGDATIEAKVNATIASAIDGTAGLTKTGPGTLELTGANTYTGGTTVTGGTLIGDTGSIRGDVALSGSSNVTFDQGSNDTYDGTIAGDGSFTKTGAGTLEVTSEAHTYNGGTTVSAGTLRVTGWLPADSTVTVEDGGTLGGAGRVGPIDLLPGGTLAPGASVGTLTADGDVTFADGGNKWVAELLGADADRVTVTSYGDSTLTLGDATALELVFGGADPFEAGTYTLASYDALVGTFSSVTDLGDYTTGTGVAYGATAITIELLANLLPGDANLDRTVDLDDFARLRNNFGTGDTWAEADFNGDDTVNLDDFAILRNNFGAHAPEPATLAILAMGGAWLAFRRRRHGTKGTKGTGMRSTLKKMAGGLVAAVLALVVAAGACQASTIMEIQIDVNTGQAYLFNPSATPGDWASVVGYTITSAGSNLLPADPTLPVGTGEWADSWLSLADQTVEFLPPPPPGQPNAYYNAALMAGEWARPELSATTSDLTDGTLGSGLWLDAGESVYIGKVVAPPGGWVEGRYGPGNPHSDLAFRILEYEAPASEASYVNLVPEPATLALIGLGGFSVLLRRKRR